MTPIEGLCIHTVDLPDGRRQIPIWRFKKEVIVIAHQAVGMTEDVESINDRLERVQEAQSICFVEERLLAIVAARHHMVDATLDLQA
jgi:hypothetical protein